MHGAPRWVCSPGDRHVTYAEVVQVAFHRCLAVAAVGGDRPRSAPAQPATPPTCRRPAGCSPRGLPACDPRPAAGAGVHLSASRQSAALSSAAASWRAWAAVSSSVLFIQRYALADQLAVGAHGRHLEPANVAVAANLTPASPQHTRGLRDPHANNTDRYSTRTKRHN